jgi:hypothetical protein
LLDTRCIMYGKERILSRYANGKVHFHADVYWHAQMSIEVDSAAVDAYLEKTSRPKSIALGDVWALLMDAQGIGAPLDEQSHISRSCR